MYGCCTKGIQARGPSRDTAIFLLLITNAGLFMVDHIHFQVGTGNPQFIWGGGVDFDLYYLTRVMGGGVRILANFCNLRKKIYYPYLE